MKKLYSVTTLGLVVILGFFSFAFAQEKLLLTLEQQIDPRITALLVIDMQNDYVADEGKVGKLGLDVKKIQTVVPTMNKLIEGARKAGGMVIWIRQTHLLRDSLPNYLASNVAKVKGNPFTEEDFLVQGGSWGAEYYGKMTKRLEGEVEVIKHTYGAFTNTELDTYLKAKGIKTIINIGCLTNVCVQSTAIQGWFQGYYSIIPSDAVGSTDISLHDATLKTHKIFYGFTPTSDEMISIWKEVDR